MAIIEARGVTKSFPAHRGGRVLLGRGGIPDWIRGGGGERFTAVNEVSLSVEAGESLGIIGGNGSGKSTLLKMLAGVTLPTSGTVNVQGRVASLLELGAGFHPMLTGRENVYLNAGLYGLSHAQVDECFESIVDFSGIRDFIDEPVNSYSSGMYVRIAFAVAVHTDPDVFLVDEVLAVGDEAFQRQCRRKIGELRASGKTILFVSHDLGIVNTVCDRVVLMSKGELIERETPQATFDFYLRQVGQAGGIHTLRQGDCEAVFSHGQISLYRAGREVTAGSAIQYQFRVMSQWHASTQADWKVERADDQSFEARGAMPRVPADLILRGTLEHGHLRLELEVLARQAFQLEESLFQLDVPSLLRHWMIGDTTVTARESTPELTEPEVETMPDTRAREAWAQPEDDVPGIRIEANPESVDAYLQLHTGTFLSDCRSLCVNVPRAAQSSNISAGDRVAFGAITLDFSQDAAAMRDAIQSRQAAGELNHGDVTASIERGSLKLRQGDDTLAECPSLLQVDGLWTLSTSLSPTSPRIAGDTLHYAAEDTRHGCTQHWSVTRHEDGFLWRVDLECTRPLAVQECNVSAMLDAAYVDWATEHESGVYPEFASQQAWIPLNAKYPEDAWISAQREDGTRFILAPADAGPPLLPSALTTGAGQARRIVQQMRRGPQGGPILLKAGRRHLLSVILRVA